MNNLYDIENKNNSDLWNIFENEPKDTLNYSNILKLCIKLQNKTKLLTKEFIFKGDKCFLLKKKKFLGMMDLNYIGLEYNNKDLKLIFFTNKKYFTLLFTNMLIFKQLKKELFKTCILNNLTKKYEILKKIDDNLNFYIAEKKNNKKKYLIKVLSKKNLKSKIDYWNLKFEIEKLKKIKFKFYLKFFQLYESKGSIYVIFESNFWNKIDIFNKNSNNFFKILKNSISNFYHYIFKNGNLFLAIIQEQKKYQNFMKFDKEFITKKFYNPILIPIKFPKKIKFVKNNVINEVEESEKRLTINYN